MERIKEALEKARTDRYQRAVGGVPRGPKRRGVQLEEMGQITYRQSRIVELDAKTLEENRIVAQAKTDPRSLYYDMLRTQVTQRMEREGWRTVAVTSPGPSCGKTVTAINLAFSISHKVGETALLVDFDLRKPSVGKYLGLTEGPSLVDYLEGNNDLHEVIVNPGVPRLVFLPNMKPIANASETLASEKVGALIKEMRNRYQERIVLVDLPPILTIDDALAILPSIDCVLLVVAAGQSTASEVRESKRLIGSENLVGVVLNKSDAKLTEYY